MISKKLNEVKRFKNLQEGDIIIVPFYSSVVLAIVGKEDIYSEKAYERSLANQRKVEYCQVEYCLEDGKLMLISRKELSEGLQRRLRVRGSSYQATTDYVEKSTTSARTRKFGFRFI
ncbi:hypothetical protein HMPREF1987_01421 [Peptostreptococcaceae bacterium oral taxon 113 str. W5053]|nr:hypothetical protein HMPREF1987_01421 [Peptostreptococcaceae bacterium oral taxon 113 str. W5053]